MLELLSYGDSGWGDELLYGLWITFSLALATLPFGLLLGFLIALAKESTEPSLQLATNIYTTIFRGLPELLTLFIVFYGFPIFLNALQNLLFNEIVFEISSFAAGMIALGTVFSAYASEVFQSAFRGIPTGQFEAGDSLGLKRKITMILVIIPQLIRLSLPGLSNLWLVLLKETALVSVIGLPDVLRQAGIAARVSKEHFFFFSIACGLYLILVIISSFALNKISQWTQKGGSH